MTIKIWQWLKRTSKALRFEDDVLTKWQMLAWDDTKYSDWHLVIEAESHDLYVYNSSVTPSAETWKFVKIYDSKEEVNNKLNLKANLQDVPFKTINIRDNNFTSEENINKFYSALNWLWRNWLVVIVHNLNYYIYKYQDLDINKVYFISINNIYNSSTKYNWKKFIVLHLDSIQYDSNDDRYIYWNITNVENIYEENDLTNNWNSLLPFKYFNITSISNENFTPVVKHLFKYWEVILRYNKKFYYYYGSSSSSKKIYLTSELYEYANWDNNTIKQIRDAIIIVLDEYNSNTNYNNFSVNNVYLGSMNHNLNTVFNDLIKVVSIDSSKVNTQAEKDKASLIYNYITNDKNILIKDVYEWFYTFYNDYGSDYYVFKSISWSEAFIKIYNNRYEVVYYQNKVQVQFDYTFTTDDPLTISYTRTLYPSSATIYYNDWWKWFLTLQGSRYIQNYIDKDWNIHNWFIWEKWLEVTEFNDDWINAYIDLQYIGTWVNFKWIAIIEYL